MKKKIDRLALSLSTETLRALTDGSAAAGGRAPLPDTLQAGCTIQATNDAQGCSAWCFTAFSCPCPGQ